MKKQKLVIELTVVRPAKELSFEVADIVHRLLEAWKCPDISITGELVRVEENVNES